MCKENFICAKLCIVEVTAVALAVDAQVILALAPALALVSKMHLHQETK